jgi:xanthine dehydrogenase accessory factor
MPPWMRQLWPELRPWINAPRPFVLATLVEAVGSSPREVGAVLAARPAEVGVEFLGGVSSGCVENDLLGRVSEVLGANRVEEHRFGPEAVTPWATGLTCGGHIRVRLEPYFAFREDPVMREIARVWHAFLDEDEPGALISRGRRHLLLMSDGSVLGERREWPAELLARALGELSDSALNGFCEGEGEEAVFVRFARPRPRLVLVGAVEIAVALARLAAALPVRVVVVDPREAYASAARFAPAVVDLRRGWPAVVVPALGLGPRDALVALSHDDKIDDPALLAALGGDCGFVGALGSGASQERRRERLLEAGVSPAEWARLRGPVGLWHGGREASSIALSVLSEWFAGSDRHR